MLNISVLRKEIRKGLEGVELSPEEAKSMIGYARRLGSTPPEVKVMVENEIKRHIA